MLTVDNQTIDLGALQFGHPHTFEYRLTNDSPRHIKINKIQVSCSSCTKATAPKQVKAGENVFVKVTYTPGAVGQSLKWLDVVYDDDQRLRLEFKAIING